MNETSYDDYMYLSHDWQNSRLLIGQLAYEVVLTSQNPILTSQYLYVCMYVHFYYLCRGRGGNHEINSLSTCLEYDTTYISQSEGCITRGAAEGDTAL